MSFFLPPLTLGYYSDLSLMSYYNVQLVLESQIGQLKGNLSARGHSSAKFKASFASI
jgi:hypothetical protein